MKGIDGHQERVQLRVAEMFSLGGCERDEADKQREQPQAENGWEKVSIREPESETKSESKTKQDNGRENKDQD